jgi:hypothetical protein
LSQSALLFVGNAAKGVKNFLTTIAGMNGEEMGIVGGDKLNARDGCSFYSPDSHYVVFSRSQYYVITETTGMEVFFFWVVLSLLISSLSFLSKERLYF